MTRTRWPLLLTALATWGVAGLHGGIEQRSPQPIRSDRLEVRLVDPGTKTLPGGAVEIEQAWHIASPDSGFGGFSALMVRADGSMRLLGDTGMVASLAPSRTTGFRLEHLSLLPGMTARTPKWARDAESLTSSADAVWAGFEHRQAVARYDTSLTRLNAERRIAAMRDWPRNGGLEAMVRLADGRFLLLSERAEVPGGTAALLFSGDPVDPATPPPLRFAYDAQGWGRLTDAAALPDGRVLLLHRAIAPNWRFWRAPLTFTTRIAIADPRTISAATPWRGRLIATIGPDHPLADNHEGLALDPARNPDGAVRLWMISDDNFNRWQRTLLVRMRVTLPPR